MFDLLRKENISAADRERVKQASRSLLAALIDKLRPIQQWTKKTGTRADVEVFILDTLYRELPRPPFTDLETERLAAEVFGYVFERSEAGQGFESGPNQGGVDW